MGCGIRYITPCNHQITHNTMTHMDIVPPTIWVIVIVYTMEPHAMFGVECGCPLSFDTNNGMVYNVGAIQTHTHTWGEQYQCNKLPIHNMTFIIQSNPHQQLTPHFHIHAM